MTKDEKKAKSQARRESRKKALNMVAAFVLDNLDESDPENKELISAAILIKPGTRVATVSRKDVVADMFTEVGDTIHENQVWENYKLGRTEMRKATVNLIKKSAPEDRFWISFNPESGEYMLEGTGPDAPEGWTGYRPVDIEDIDL